MGRLIRAVPLSILLTVFIGTGRLHAESSAISKEFDKIAQALSDDFRAKFPDEKEVPLAILPFNTTKALARRGIGFAVSDLLSQHFMKAPVFVLVERAALNKVIEEQRLHATGAIDSASAVRIGRLIGARFLILGRVEKLAGRYHVTARMIDTESGKVAALGYAELSAKLFEEEARPLLALAPKRQTIGLYFLFNYRHNPNNLADATFSEYYFGTPRTNSPGSFSVGAAGLGIRYFPIQALAVDVAGALFANRPVVASQSEGTKIKLTQTFFMRGLVLWAPTIGRKSRVYLGGGASLYRIGGSDNLNGYSYTTPVLRTGYEYRVQERLGLSLFLNYDLITKKGKTGRLFGEVETVRLGKLSFEPSIALYF